MKINELIVTLNELGIDKDTYSIMSGGLPNEKLCIAKNNKWEIYYSERGIKTMIQSFDDEGEACRFFLNKIMKSSGN